MSDQRPLRALVPTELMHGLTRRGFLSASLAVGGTFALAACSTGTSPGSGIGEQLNIYTWGDYDDPDVIKTFTSENGPSITMDSYGSNPEMIAKLSAAKGTTGYDICVPTQLFIPQMVAGGLLAPLDHSRLPNMSHLEPSVLDPEWDPNNKYSVCKAWGTTGYLYDSTRISRELTSWADFWDAAQNEASGSLSLLEDQIAISNAYFFANEIEPKSANASSLAAYRSFILDTIAPHVQVFSSSTAGAIAQSSQMLIQAWNGDARLGKLNSDDPDRYTFVWPSEGSNRWQDNWAIVAGAPNEDAAHAFINYVLDPDVSLKELQYFGNNTGIKGISEKAAAAGVEMPDLIFVDDEVMSKLVYDEAIDANETIIAIYDELTAKAGT